MIKKYKKLLVSLSTQKSLVSLKENTTISSILKIIAEEILG